MKLNRRDFLTQAGLASVAISTGLPLQGEQHPAAAREVPAKPLFSAAKRPVIICKPTGLQSIDAAYKMLTQGDDTLDAALHMCKTQEDDPNDDTVGLGGLPNEEGVVELDSCCMHGPTRRAGAVGGVREIKNVCLVAKAVMERTGHVMLVGEGAQRFAVATGFPKENLLTERSRKIWLLWKESHSDKDWWGPGPSDPNWQPPKDMPGKATSQIQSAPLPLTRKSLEARIARLQPIAVGLGIEPEFRRQAALRVLLPPTGTIHVSVVNDKGEMSGATTTSGLAWKLPGRVGDSAILGAGCYTDQDVGSAGATGSGEENIKVAGAHTIVENMRRGMTPLEAGMDVLQRIARNHNHDMSRLRYLDMVYYILRRDGVYACVSLWSGHKFAVHDGSKHIEQCVPLFQGNSIDWPPTPKLPEEK